MFTVQGKDYQDFIKISQRMGYITKVSDEEKAVGVTGLSKERQLRFLEIKELLALAYLLDMKVIRY